MPTMHLSGGAAVPTGGTARRPALPFIYLSDYKPDNASNFFQRGLAG